VTEIVDGERGSGQSQRAVGRADAAQAGTLMQPEGALMSGKVKRLVSERGFGFVTAEDGKDYFFHRSQTDAFDDLREGDVVTFEVEADTPKGPPAARVALAAEGAIR
jgi:cold shock protein